MKINGLNIIGNKESGQGTETFKAYNPKTLEQLTEIFFIASDSEIEQAALWASDAFEIYKTTPADLKAKFLRMIADNILDLGNALLERASLESAIEINQLSAERTRTVNQLRMFADLLEDGSWVGASIDTGLPNRKPVPKPDLRRMMIPIGPVVVFTASNFPFAYSTAGGDTSSALAAGNPVIVKGHESHPGTNEMVAKAIQKAAQKCGLPKGVFSSLNGNSPRVGQSLVKHPLVKAVGFTGSFRGGKAIFDSANQRAEPIPVYAEMGSTNPIFILPEILKEKKEENAKLIAGAVTKGSGQFCTKPGLLFGVKSKDWDTFSELLAREIKSITGKTLLNRGIYKNFEDAKKHIIANDAVTLVAESDEQPNFELTARPAIAKVDAQAFIKNQILHEEVFGPFTMLISCKSFAELKEVSCLLKGQLTVSIMASNAELAENQSLINIIREKAGRIIFNGVPTGVEVNSSTNHGGPYPATTDVRTTSVGTAAISRFIRPLSFQNCPDALLPLELQNNNPKNIWRMVNGRLSKAKI